MFRKSDYFSRIEFIMQIRMYLRDCYDNYKYCGFSRAGVMIRYQNNILPTVYYVAVKINESIECSLPG